MDSVMNRFDEGGLINANTAKRVADAHNLDMVIVIASKDQQSAFATFGTTIENKGRAASVGNAISKLINATPAPANFDSACRNFGEIIRQASADMMSMLIPTPHSIPRLHSTWQHDNGQLYLVTNVSNTLTKRPVKYPVTIFYENIETGSQWSRPMWDWHRSMTAVD